jgi:pyridoxamine 5'-phosphate oxidase family protein
VGTFTEAELEYLNSQPLGRIATVGPDGSPHLASVEPWRARGIEIRGRAQTHTDGGQEVGERVGATFPFQPAWIHVFPKRILAWGVDSDSYELTARDVGYAAHSGEARG